MEDNTYTAADAEDAGWGFEVPPDITGSSNDPNVYAPASSAPASTGAAGNVFGIDFSGGLSKALDFVLQRDKLNLQGTLAQQGRVYYSNGTWGAPAGMQSNGLVMLLIIGAVIWAIAKD